MEMTFADNTQTLGSLDHGTPDWHEEERRVSHNRCPGNGLLESKGGDGDHSQTTILDLGVAGLLRIHLEWVKHDHSRQIVVRTLARVQLVVNRLPLHPDSETQDGSPIDRRDSAEATVEHRWHTAVRSQQSRNAKSVAEGTVQELGHWPAGSGKHRQTAVLNLGLSVPGQLARVVCKLQRIEVPVASKSLVTNTHNADFWWRWWRRRRSDLSLLHYRGATNPHVQAGTSTRESKSCSGEGEHFFVRVRVVAAMLVLLRADDGATSH
mmetsp:Transcript_23768/g.49778  ORF Transcript_23768/g.49778 Transcript_23768/m.49778 type:complete len:266 (-) Transcript_23768:7-804(-)